MANGRKANPLGRPLMQGAAAVNRAAFAPAQRRPRKKNGNGRGKANGQGGAQNWRLGLHALAPQHLALPRAVGPYTVTKTTDVFSFNAVATVIGPMSFLDASTVDGDPVGTKWSNVIGLRSVTGGDPINGADNTVPLISAGVQAEGYAGARVVPASVTVQIMNQAALQTTNGVVYGGRLKYVPDLRNDSRTWNDYMNLNISYNAPRLLTAGKLALRGVTVDEVPFNMNQLADFRVIDTSITLNPVTYDASKEYTFNGFAPIFIFNPGQIPLQYLVTIEWRTRFDPSNPAQAAHRHHPITSDKCWDGVVRSMHAEGHGMHDIVETVATVGHLAATASQIGAQVAPLLAA